MPDEKQDVELPPYIIEGARSSRSRCKTCRRKINKGSPRIGMLIEGPFGTGYLWHHINCAARRQFERVEEAYRLEAWNEAKEPLDKVPDLAELGKLRTEADERKSKRKELPYAEPAPTGRARCKHCGEPIEKGSLRVTLGRLVEFGNQVRTTPIHVHPRCVAAEVDSEDCGTERDGFGQALRANSGEVPADQLDAVLTEIGISA